MLILWICLSIFFFIIEVATTQIVTIWFAVGAVGAIFANVLNANFVLQVVVFAVISLIAILIARPYFKKFTKTQIQPTNADMYIGKEAIVIEKIDNTLGTGQVKVKGSLWTAKSIDGSVIEKDSTVYIDAISGVKLVVKKINYT